MTRMQHQGLPRLLPLRKAETELDSQYESRMLAPALAADVVRKGGVVAYPTEAVYGLGCDPNQLAAVQRIVDMKERASNKGLILIAATQEQLTPWIAAPNPDEQARIDQHWPGPVTLIVKAAEGLPSLLTGGRKTIAVRVSTHPTVRALCLACGHALVSTSANLSGQNALRCASAINAEFGSDIDGIIEGTLGTLDGATPIIDLQSGARLR